MTSSHVSLTLGDWNASPDFARELAARVPYVYAPGDGAWAPTSDVLSDLLGWPAEWEARIEEMPVRADVTCPGCTFLDIRGRDPRRPQDELGTTIAVSGWDAC
ncbi:MAG TPA: hypothetical protein VGB53_13230 [Rubricoccaceae bacterium]|jgi:hypothetical protein